MNFGRIGHFDHNNGHDNIQQDNDLSAFQFGLQEKFSNTLEFIAKSETSERRTYINSYRERERILFKLSIPEPLDFDVLWNLGSQISIRRLKALKHSNQLTSLRLGLGHTECDLPF